MWLGILRWRDVTLKKMPGARQAARKSSMCAFVNVEDRWRFREPQSQDGFGRFQSYEGFLKWGTPKSSILIGFSIVKHSFWGSPIYGFPIVYVSALVFRRQALMALPPFGSTVARCNRSCKDMKTTCWWPLGGLLEINHGAVSNPGTTWNRLEPVGTCLEVH